MAKVTYLRTKGASIDGQEASEQILDAGVIFQREIDGIPVVGFGGFAMVNIASDESVVAASKVWRDIDKKGGRQKCFSQTTRLMSYRGDLLQQEQRISECFES